MHSLNGSTDRMHYELFDSLFQTAGWIIAVCLIVVASYKPAGDVQ